MKKTWLLLFYAFVLCGCVGLGHKSESGKLKEAFIALHNYDRGNDYIISHLIEVLKRAPDSAMSYHLIFNGLPVLIFESSSGQKVQSDKSEYPWIESLKKYRDLEGDEGRVACQVALTASYGVFAALEENRIKRQDDNRKDNNVTLAKYLKELENAIDVLQYRKYKKFHPLCRMLRVYSLDYDNSSEMPVIEKDLKWLSHYNRDYQFIVGLYRKDIELKSSPPTFQARGIVLERKFDYIMQQDIKNTSIWFNPLPVTEASTILMFFPPGEQKTRMMLKIIPLLNDENDPPLYNREKRMAFYQYLSKNYMNKAELEKARSMAQHGLELAVKNEDTEEFKSILNEIHRKSSSSSVHK